MARCRICLTNVESVDDHLVEVHRMGTWSTDTVRALFEPVPRGSIVGDEPLPFGEVSQG